MYKYLNLLFYQFSVFGVVSCFSILLFASLDVGEGVVCGLLCGRKSRLFGLCLGSGFLNGITSRVTVCFLFGTFLVFRIEGLPIISFSPREFQRYGSVFRLFVVSFVRLNFI